MKKLAYALIAALILVVALAQQAPAWLATHWVQQKIGIVQFTSTEGSFLCGYTDVGTLQGRVLISRLHWRLNGWSLLAGSLEGRLLSAQKQLIAEFEVDRNGQRWRNITLDLPIDSIAELWARWPGVASGMLELRSSNLSLSSSGVDGSGRVVWHSAIWRMAPEVAPVALGEVTVQIASLASSLQAQIDNTGGDLMIRGQASWALDRRGTINLILTPTPTTPRELMPFLSRVGQSRPDGSIEINWPL